MKPPLQRRVSAPALSARLTRVTSKGFRDPEADVREYGDTSLTPKTLPFAFALGPPLWGRWITAGRGGEPIKKGRRAAGRPPRRRRGLYQIGGASAAALDQRRNARHGVVTARKMRAHARPTPVLRPFDQTRPTGLHTR